MVATDYGLLDQFGNFFMKILLETQPSQFSKQSSCETSIWLSRLAFTASR